MLASKDLFTNFNRPNSRVCRLPVEAQSSCPADSHSSSDFSQPPLFRTFTVLTIDQLDELLGKWNHKAYHFEFVSLLKRHLVVDIADPPVRILTYIPRARAGTCSLP